jgi:hypothetical protein
MKPKFKPQCHHHQKKKKCLEHALAYRKHRSKFSYSFDLPLTVCSSFLTHSLLWWTVPHHALPSHTSNIVPPCESTFCFRLLSLSVPRHLSYLQKTWHDPSLPLGGLCSMFPRYPAYAICHSTHDTVKKPVTCLFGPLPYTIHSDLTHLWFPKT